VLTDLQTCELSQYIVFLSYDRAARQYLSTAGTVGDKTAASSLTRCGLFPVLSSCLNAPTTMSSLMPSVSILLSPSRKGEGGGDNSATVLGFSSFIRMFVVRGGLISPETDEVVPCDHFVFLIGRSSPSTIVLGGEGCDAPLARLGTVMPSSDSESDFRLVL